MGQLWITVLLIYLGINIALWAGTSAMLPYTHDYDAAYNASQTLIGNVTDTSSGTESGMWDYLIAQFLSPAILGGAMLVGILGRFFTGSSSIAIFAAASVVLSSWFLNPMTAMRALGLPSPFDVIMLLILNGMLLIAIVDFVRG